MANLPVLRSRETIIGNIIDGFLSRRPEVNDLSRNSALSQLFTAAGQSQFKASASVIGMIDAISVDRAIGEALQRIARDRNVPIFPATSATGKIDITDTSFSKIQTTVYAGQPAPVAGALVVFVADASKFQASNGRIYVGRGTSNVEGPLEYASVQPEAGGAYWSITLKASSATTKFHNIGETVIFAQGGNRLISTGSIVQTAQGAAVTSVQFRTTADVAILDGEVTVTNVPVICTRPGTVGNVPRGAIREGIGLPFSASVFNQQPFTTGRSADTDDQIKARIKLFEQAKARGTEQAIQYFAQNVVAPDELKKVQSAKVVSSANNTATLVYNDGSTNEPLFVGAGFEFVVDSAIGGEKELQLRNRPLAQARVKNQKAGPYSVVDLSYLSVQVQGVITTHQFKAADFKVPSAATASEVAASINGDSTINFLANTAEGGTKVVVYPREKAANDVQVITPSAGVDSNLILGFPKVRSYTLLLYEDDQPLFQDGLTASVLTRSQSTWSNSVVPGDTLIYTVDGTTQVTATFTLALFQSIDPTASVSSLTSADVWVKAFQLAMPGVSARVVTESIELASNLGANNRAKLEITGGTLKDKIFDPAASLVATGRASDYTLNRYTGQLSKAKPMTTGSKLTAGTPFTRAKATTTSIPAGTTAPGRFWVITDGDSKLIPNSLAANTQVEFTKVGTKLTITAQTPALVPQGFDNVQPGDWLLAWGNSTDPSQLQANMGYWRVETVQVGQIVVDDGTVSRSGLGSFFVPITDRFVFVRSAAPIQEVEFTQTSLSAFASEVQSQIVGCDVEIVGGAVRISTKTADSSGELFFVTADNGGRNLALPLQSKIQNVASQYGFSQNELDAECKMPSFTHGAMGTAASETQFTQSDYRDLGGDGMDFLEFLDKFDAPSLTTIPETNKGRRTFVSDYEDSTSQLTISPPQYLLNPPTTPPTGSTVQAGDRFFLRTSYQFDSRDQVTVIVDQDAVTKTYRLPVARKITVSSHSTPTLSDFSADDAESSLSLNDPASFAGFDFSNFRAWRRSQNLLTDGTYSLSVRYADHGPAGDRVRVGFVYPDEVSETVLGFRVAASDAIDVGLIIPVKTPRVPNWTAQSSFTTTVTTTGGKDSITYSWRAGTQPDFVAAGVVAGDVAIINSNSSFLAGNKGFSAKVTSVSATSFTVERPTGLAASDALAVQTLVNQGGTMTITFASPHSISQNDVIALWGTAISSGSTRPLDGAYTPTIISTTQVTVPTPPGTPGGAVTGVNHVNGIVTLTIPGHGLSAGNVILVSGLAISALNGLYAVLDVPTSSTVRYVRSGSLGSAAAGGRADFQSFQVGPSSAAISSLSRSGNVATVNTGVPHGLNPGDLVRVASTDVTAWSNLTTYGSGDVVKFSGQYYVSLIGSNVGNQPDTSPADWAITTQTFNGTWIVNTTPTSSQFTFLMADSGSMVGVASLGNAAKMVVAGSLARGAAGSTAPYLQFADVGTTAQQVVDYVAQSLSNVLTVTLAGGTGTEPISTSTEDLDRAANYLSGTITSLQTRIASRLAFLTTSTAVKAGSRINVSGMSDPDYDDQYVVLASVQSGGNYVLTVQSDTLAAASAVVAQSATFVGSAPYRMLVDGDNAVQSSNLASLIGSPMFTAKRAWTFALSIGEELRLVSLTNEQLNRFWARLVVTGLTNVAKVDLDHFGEQLQVTTLTFGSGGSIEFAGGTANAQVLAAVGSSSVLGIDVDAPEGKIGQVYVPFDLRQPITSRAWMTVENEVRSNKIVGLTGATTLKLHADGLEIVSGPGTFQTQHSTTQGATTRLKIEKHGAFFLVTRISGPSLALSTGGVKEGSWAKLRNVAALPWNIVSTYNPGDRVSFDQVIYTALTTNAGLEPDTNPTAWQVTQLSEANQGIFRVVRTFGQDSFWVESNTMLEEVCILGHANSLTFYSYDSVMPGDTLVVSTAAFGAVNIGRYVVRDELFNPSYSFPTSSRIFTDTVPNPPVSNVLLGGDANQVTIEEAQPLRLWKRVHAVGPGPGSLASVMLDSPNLVSRTGSSQGTFMTLRSKLAFDESINFGVDAYNYYQGLIKELTRVIYGDPVSPVSHPGVRAAGTTVEIEGALIKRIKVDLSVRIRTGLPFGEVRDKIKSAVAGYVNTLDVGAQVSLSKIVAVANAVSGVVAVAITFPTYDANNDVIPVGANETPFVADPTTDVTVSIIGL